MHFFKKNPAPLAPCFQEFFLLLTSFGLFVFILGGCAPMEQNAPQLAETETIAETPAETFTEDTTIPEPEQTASLEIEKLASLGEWEEGAPAPQLTDEEEEVTYDFPVTMNKQVEFYLNFFQNEQRKTFSRWLSRSSRYIPHVKQQLAEAGLPEDLCYLPLIESGYSLTAYSRARAAGPWQFMRATGRNYGLRINEYVDERRDLEKATKAAISYLSNLYEEFGSWHLAVAAYNAGEGKIRRAIKKYNTNNFWELAKGRYLHLETKRYVPKLIAAIMIAKDPEKYGFTDIEIQPALEYEVVNVPRWTSLKAVSLAGDIDFEELHNLNRQLRRAITPPSQANYPLKVPPGKKTVIAENLKKTRAIVTTRYQEHLVKKGETLTRICKKYNLNKTTLLKANNLQYEQLSLGQRLRIPYQTTTYKLLSDAELAKLSTPASTIAENLVLHKVRPGETVGILSKRYNVPIHMIAAWNDLADPSRIRAGQQLAFYLQDANTATTGAPVKTAAGPAKKAGHSPQMLASKRRPAASEKSALTYYLVKGGDTLWSIAQKFQLTPQKIKRWNQMDDDVIHPGNRLLLKLAADIDT